MAEETARREGDPGMTIRVCIAGATGNFGRRLARAVLDAPDLELAAAVGRTHADSISHNPYVAGTLLAVRKVVGFTGLRRGLASLLDLGGEP